MKLPWDGEKDNKLMVQKLVDKLFCLMSCLCIYDNGLRHNRSDVINIGTPAPDRHEKTSCNIW